MPKLLLATRNQNKKIELQRILNDLNIAVLTFQDLDELPEIEEDGDTFEENAIKKSQLTAFTSGLVALADDSGLMVDYLGGQPGIYSARFAGEGANDQKNNEKLLGLLQNVPEEKRTARFVCVIAISDGAGNTETVKGSCEGKIAFEASGNAGFGYDPLFIPDGFGETFAELEPDIKNQISHRGKALLQVKPIIAKFFGND